MERTAELQIIKTIMQYVDSGKGKMAEAESTIPVQNYYDQARFDCEISSIFKKQPFPLVHKDEVKKGEFKTRQLFDMPLLITEYGVFLNVCRHRGATLKTQPTGKLGKSITCPYHAWSYNLDGTLKAIPHRDCFPSINGDTRLVQLKTFEFMNFIWVIPNLDLEADPTTHFVGLHDELAGLTPEMAEVYHVGEEVRNLNWKLVQDLFLEVYHLRTAHRDSIGGIFFDNLYLYEEFYPHLRTVNPKKRIEKLKGRKVDSWHLRDVCNVEYVLFPNIIMLVEPNHVDFVVSEPLTADSTRVRFYSLVRGQPTSPTEKTALERSAQIVHKAYKEDMEIGESIQAGLRSGANQHLTFGRQEEAIELFHNAIADRLS